jgi:hypothetical protein
MSLVIHSEALPATSDEPFAAHDSTVKKKKQNYAVGSFCLKNSGQMQFHVVFSCNKKIVPWRDLLHTQHKYLSRSISWSGEDARRFKLRCLLQKV